MLTLILVGGLMGSWATAVAVTRVSWTLLTLAERTLEETRQEALRAGIRAGLDARDDEPATPPT